MITYNELKEKCTCWTGYKRKPGTKPCAEGSCVKEEVSSSEKHHALAFGRMNPITSGHEAVVNKLHSVAKENGASHSLVVSHSQDAKKNPLTAEQKVKHAKNAFPGTNVTAASKESPTILHHAAAAHAAGATHLHVIAGSDRHEEMHNLLHKYNGKDSSHGHYNFKKITVHSSGERDPDAEGTTGISASKMREHAASGNKQAFHAGAPSKMKPEHKDAMYNDVRKGMNLKEETQIDELKHSTVSNYMRRARTQLSNIEVSRRSSGDEKFGAEKARRRANTLNKIADKTDSRAVRDQLQKATAFVKEQAPVAPVPDRKYIKGTPEWKAHKEKSKPINGHPTNVKEETTDQQADRTMQLKRFKDQMTKLNGPNVDTEIPLDKKEKDIMTGKVKPKNKTELGLSKQEQDNLADVNEHLTAAAGAGAWINDFISSTNPRFNNKSKEERRKMAIGAYMAAKAKGVQEATLQGNVGGGDAMNTTTSAPSTKVPQGGVKKIKGFKFFNGTNEPNTQMTVKEARGLADKFWSMAQNHKENAKVAKGSDYNAHMANHHEAMSRYHEELGQSSHAQSHADKAEAYHEKSMESAKTVKEETLDEQDIGKHNNATTGFKPLVNKLTPKYGKEVAGKIAGSIKKKIMAKEEVELEEGYDKSSEHHKNARKMAKDYDGKATFHPNGHAEVRMRSIVHGHSTINPQGTTLMSGEDLAKRASKEHGKGKVEGNIVHFKEEVEQIEERNKANALMRKTMDASRGAKFKLKNPVPDADPKHKTARDHNVAIGRALRNEAATGNPGGGYHGACGTADDMYSDMHKHVKNLTDADDKTVKHYLDSGHGEKLAGREQDHDYIKADFKKFMKYYRPEMHDPKPAVKEETAPVGKPQKITLKTAVIKLHPNGVASDTEEGWAKPKKIKEGNMKSYKEFLQSLDEKLIGKQKKLDKNHNGALDKNDFELLRKEKTEQIDEIKLADLPVRKIQGRSYGADYKDPEGADDAWEKEKTPKAGRKAGSGAGVYKPRKTMSKLKQLGATYK